MQTELTLSNVKKKYKSVLALRDFSYTFTPGVYGILGPNGAGKSTMMNIITDNLNLTEGKVLYNGQDIHSMGKNYRSHLGYMPQQQEVYEELTLNRFLFYMASLKGLGKAQAKEEIDRLCEMVNLTPQRRQRMGQLSGGMKQRALIVQALLGNPDILIMDEPTAGLDPKERIRIRNLISQVARDKIVLISTHVVPDIEFISKEVLFLKKGELVANGDVPALCERLDGRVYDIVADPQQVQELEQKYKCSALTSFGSQVKVRVITSERPQEPCEEVKATLEDLYLDIFE
jgi:ABC-type multidrug transport system ATPase subunit